MRGQTGCGTRVEEEREGPGAFRSWYAMGRERAQPSLILHLSPARALPDAGLGADKRFGPRCRVKRKAVGVILMGRVTLSWRDSVSASLLHAGHVLPVFKN